jgi:hypothetical protein
MGPGLRNPTDEFFVDFYGPKTVRLDGLPDKSETFVEIMELPLMQELANHLPVAELSGLPAQHRPVDPDRPRRDRPDDPSG